MTDPIFDKSSAQQRDALRTSRTEREKAATPFRPDALIEVRTADLVALAGFMYRKARTEPEQEALLRVGQKLGWQGGVNWEALVDSWTHKPCSRPGCEAAVKLDEGACVTCRATYGLPLAQAEEHECPHCSDRFFGTQEFCSSCQERIYLDERRPA